jgi:hypothetical protein
MALLVKCCAQYLSEPVEKMRPRDYDATHLVKAVKGLPLSANSYSDVQIDGKRVRIREKNKDAAIEWFAAWAAQKIEHHLGTAAKVLIPIPSSHTVVASPADFRTAAIAAAVARRCTTQVSVAPILRFLHPMLRSRDERGPRDWPTLKGALCLTGLLPAGNPVLVDDVLTGGGHLVAAAKILEDDGRSTALAVVCGRSLHHQLDDPFVVDDEMLPMSAADDFGDWTEAL